MKGNDPRPATPVIRADSLLQSRVVVLDGTSEDVVCNADRVSSK